MRDRARPRPSSSKSVACLSSIGPVDSLESGPVDASSIGPVDSLESGPVDSVTLTFVLSNVTDLLVVQPSVVVVRRGMLMLNLLLVGDLGVIVRLVDL